LRVVAHVALFLAPLALLGVVAAGSPVLARLAALLAVLSAALGVGVERWLFFAEAQHVSMVFYDRAG
jgi:DMSO reductase anchor subunit